MIAVAGRAQLAAEARTGDPTSCGVSDAVGSSRIRSRARRAQRARDFDELLFGQAQRGGFTIDVDPRADARQQLARAIASRAPVDPRPRAGRLQPEREVLGDAEIGKSVGC